MIRVIAGPPIVNSHWLGGEICTNGMLSIHPPVKGAMPSQTPHWQRQRYPDQVLEPKSKEPEMCASI